MSITYEEALETLQSMFGPPWTRETLDAVLRHHGGHMENTIESVLTHGERDPQLLLQHLKSGISVDEEIARQLGQDDGNTGNSGGGATTTSSQRSIRELRGTPTTLPPDFLRIPNRSAAAAGLTTTTTTSSNGAAMDPDEALARMLQDEFFAEELANNPEFAHLARGRPRTVGGMPVGSVPPVPRIGELPGRGFGSISSSQQQERRNSRPSSDQQGQDFNIIEKLSELGDNARRRLAMLAAQFNAKNTNQPRGGAGGSSGLSTERKGLLNDEEDAIEFMSRKDK